MGFPEESEGGPVYWKKQDGQPRHGFGVDCSNLEVLFDLDLTFLLRALLAVVDPSLMITTLCPSVLYIYIVPLLFNKFFKLMTTFVLKYL